MISSNQHDQVLYHIINKKLAGKIPSISLRSLFIFQQEKDIIKKSLKSCCNYIPQTTSRTAGAFLIEDKPSVSTPISLSQCHCEDSGGKHCANLSYTYWIAIKIPAFSCYNPLEETP